MFCSMQMECILYWRMQKHVQGVVQKGARESGAVGCSDSFGSGGLWMLFMSVFVRLRPSAFLKGIGLLNVFEL